VHTWKGTKFPWSPQWRILKGKQQEGCFQTKSSAFPCGRAIIMHTKLKNNKTNKVKPTWLEIWMVDTKEKQLADVLAMLVCARSICQSSGWGLNRRGTGGFVHQNMKNECTSDTLMPLA